MKNSTQNQQVNTKKVEITKAQISTVQYAIQWWMDAVDGCEGVGNEIRSAKAFMKKLDKL